MLEAGLTFDSELPGSQGNKGNGLQKIKDGMMDELG